MMEMFKLDRGDTQLQAYLFQSPEEKAVLQITHGAAEHARRYTEFAEWMAERGITVYTMDNRGHGLSQKEGEEHVIIAPEDANKLPEDVIAL
ncbi:MAG TPA: alpha/beta hydrolase, partial [Tissierellia bacterium]|nr:alpha/beta hydrolase [Tissierellia bacterium]